MTKKIRFDNLAPCVKKVLKGSERIYTDSFQKATSYYGFGLLPCTPGKGSDKGDVEREIRTQARRIKNRISVTRRVFQDFEDFNEWLVDFCKKHLTPTAKELWSKEQLTLKPLPPRDDEILCKTSIMPVSAHGTIRLGTSVYSVPDEAIKQSVRVVVGPYDVTIHAMNSNSRIVAKHRRKSDNEHSILMAHSLRSLIRKPHAMVRWKHKDILFPKPIFKSYYTYLQKILDYGAEQEFLKTINLVQHASLDEIATAMDLCLEVQSQNPFMDIKTMLLGAPEQLQIPIQNQLRPILSIYDDLIPTYQKVSNQ
jgi:hypothetical protein